MRTPYPAFQWDSDCQLREQHCTQHCTTTLDTKQSDNDEIMPEWKARSITPSDHED